MRAKPKRTTQEPSKYTSLERLKQIQRDHYMGANGVDYDKDSVDRMIWHKETVKAEREARKLEKQWDEYPDEEEYIYMSDDKPKELNGIMCENCFHVQKIPKELMLVKRPEPTVEEMLDALADLEFENVTRESMRDLFAQHVYDIDSDEDSIREDYKNFILDNK